MSSAYQPNAYALTWLDTLTLGTVQRLLCSCTGGADAVAVWVPWEAADQVQTARLWHILAPDKSSTSYKSCMLSNFSVSFLVGQTDPLVEKFLRCRSILNILFCGLRDVMDMVCKRVTFIYVLGKIVRFILSTICLFQITCDRSDRHCHCGKRHSVGRRGDGNLQHCSCPETWELLPFATFHTRNKKPGVVGQSRHRQMVRHRPLEN